ncbi:MAG: 3-isopropylmalate dehydratase/homoaconitate hydratase family large subunit [Ignisphaera sp.]|uniref:3-isopropylmalate dehydratase large subunit n=1 Tax=Ignisphaera aggregans TaxID=334771 RepID=A0A7C4NMH1_9CREN
MGLIDILISKAVGKEVVPGDIVIVDVDVVYAQDGTAPLVIEVIEKELRLNKLLAADRAYFFIDHSAPAPHVAAATVHKEMRNFAKKYGVKIYDVGHGICHQVALEEVVRPGMVVLGADSHTPTIGAMALFALGVGSTDAATAIAFGKQWVRVPPTVKLVLSGKPGEGLMSKDIILNIIGELGTDGMIGKVAEFHGDTLKYLSMDARFTLTNMCTEMSAESAIIPLDDVAKHWLDSRGVDVYRHIDYDSKKSQFVDEIVFEVSEMEPVVAAPPDVDNIFSVEEIEEVEVDQVFIGSCTNGRLEDIEVAAKILKGRKVDSNVRCIISPASRRVYMEALKRGYLEILAEAGCILTPPTCGPCVGAHLGLLAEGEVTIATTNRNFPGRMGHKNSKVYLASPATAAASAIEGKIADPRKYLRGV